MENASSPSAHYLYWSDTEKWWKYSGFCPQSLCENSKHFTKWCSGCFRFQSQNMKKRSFVALPIITSLWGSLFIDNNIVKTILITRVCIFTWNLVNHRLNGFVVRYCKREGDYTTSFLHIHLFTLLLIDIQ